MINTLRLISRQSLYRQLCQVHRCIIQRTESSAVTEAAPLASPFPSESKIDRIADDITALNLIEVAKLSELLKKRLNLPDAPVMPVGGFAAASIAEEKEEAQTKKVQTEFTVKMTEFDNNQKVTLIKEIKNLLPNTNLVQAKKFVESVPVVVKADISKDEAEKLKETLSKVGAVIEIQ